MAELPSYPTAVDPTKVGTYPARTKAGGGFVWDEVLEYRVWCHDVEGGSDWFQAFATYAEALAFSRATAGAGEPLELIRQDEYLEEPESGRFIHVKAVRLTEWPVVFLSRPRRTASTIPDFLSPTAPPNRLEILRGTKTSPP